MVVALLTTAVWVAAVQLELFERYLQLTAGLERWQVDELMFVLTAFACGLAWFALRRWREAQRLTTMHRTAEQRVAELLAHNRELAQQLIAVQENERRALARELHDEVGQSCAVIRVEAALVDRAALAAPQQARAAAQRIEEAADALHQCVRGMLRRLRPADLDALGLVGAIESLCERWQRRSGIVCRFAHEGEGWSTLSDAQAVTVYRVAQEALSNVMRHARATQVGVALSLRACGATDGAGLVLSVQDDGVGMASAGSGGGLGLLGARERAALLGGVLLVEGSAGRGTRLRMSLPLASPPGAAPAGAQAARTAVAEPGTPARPEGRVELAA